MIGFNVATLSAIAVTYGPYNIGHVILQYEIIYILRFDKISSLETILRSRE